MNERLEKKWGLKNKTLKKKKKGKERLEKRKTRKKILQKE